ncbi:hypothetical protein Q8F55_002240 [Vanrija albida]|uniref:Uncharacterized protein n=1 Tax=Vanrija albida TaxID=181172 RepID=A0ABR3Q9A2_9TREE
MEREPACVNHFFGNWVDHSDSYDVTFLTLYEDEDDIESSTPEEIQHRRRMTLMADVMASYMPNVENIVPCNLADPLSQGKWEDISRFQVKGSEEMISIWEATRALLKIAGGEP